MLQHIEYLDVISYCLWRNSVVPLRVLALTCSSVSTTINHDNF